MFFTEGNWPSPRIDNSESVRFPSVEGRELMVRRNPFYELYSFFCFLNNLKLIYFWHCAIVLRLLYCLPFEIVLSQMSYYLKYFRNELYYFCVLILYHRGQFWLMSFEIFDLTFSRDFFSSGTSLQLDVRAIPQLLLLCTLTILWSINFLL